VCRRNGTHAYSLVGAKKEIGCLPLFFSLKLLYYFPGIVGLASILLGNVQGCMFKGQLPFISSGYLPGIGMVWNMIIKDA